MANHDLLERFIFENMPVRGEHIQLHKSFQTIINQHPYPPSIRRLLGEALCVAGLLSAIIKFNGRLTVQFRGKGKLKLLLAQCDNQFQLRGLAKWEGDLSYDHLMDAFNDGVLVIMLDFGINKNRYQGIVSWRGNSLVESIEGYFKDSEQLATKIWLAVDEEKAMGFLLQVIPASDQQINQIEKGQTEKKLINPYWEQVLKPVTSLTQEEMLHLDYQSLLRKLYPQEAIRIFHSMPVSFHCTCSRKRSEDAIALIGKKEAEEELNNKQSIVVTCDFCNKEYFFDRVDVAKIFASKDKPPSDTHLH